MTTTPQPIYPSTALIPEPGMADPHALVLDDQCYLFTGHDIGHDIPDWVMPDWRIYHSSNLLDWTHVGTISPSDNFMGEGNTNCWAGDIVHRNGLFYWFFSNHNLSTGVMVSEEVTGPYRDALGKPLVESFDPTVFEDSDGAGYLIYGHGDYKIALLDDSMTALAEKPRPIEIDRKGLFPVMDKNALHKHGDLYYLSCSGYYAVSDSVYGPYEYQGLVGKGFGLDTPFGHGDFFEFKDHWYHVWCKYRDRDHDRIRDCFIAPTFYDENGKMYDDTATLSDKHK